MKIVNNFFSKGHPRTILARKNIFASFVIKGILLLTGFIKVPLFIDYLGREQYGILITILSLVTWLNYFDFGLGHGLRNHLTIAIANNDLVRAKNLVSTAYISFFVLTVILFIIFIPLIYVVNWNNLLNIHSITLGELQMAILIVIITFLLRFVFNLITSIFRAYQLPALGDVFLPIGAIISTVAVVLLKYYAEASLLFAVLVSTIPTLIIVLFMNFYFFSRRFKKILPSVKFFDRKELHNVVNLGIKFFTIQLLGMVLFSFSNIIITMASGPDEVVSYNIASKLLGIPYMLFVIVLIPFWSGITDAYAKSEIEWIKKTISSLLKYAFVLAAATAILAIISKYIYQLWLGDRVEISNTLTIMLTFQFSLMAVTSVFGQFINGVGKLRVGIYISIIISIVFLPVAFYFTGLMGSAGLVLALILVNYIPSSVLGPYQYFLIINQRAKGIWNK